MRAILDLFLPVVASPALVLFLKFFGLFDLKPLAHWGFNPDASKFVVSAVGAIFAYHRVKVRTRLWLLGAGVLAFAICLYLYDFVSRVPPTVETRSLYDNVGFSSFFMYYLSFGFCVAHVCKFFTQKK